MRQRSIVAQLNDEAEARLSAQGTGHSRFRLLRERRFAPFFGIQFLGAFNDNVFKQAS